MVVGPCLGVCYTDLPMPTTAGELIAPLLRIGA